MFRQYSQPAPVIFGCGALSILGEQIKERGCKKVLCVYDPGIEKAGFLEKAIKSLKAAGVDYALFNGVKSDPSDAVVDAGGAVALREQVDCVAGIGGGSSMDAAKAIAILLTNPGPARTYIQAKPITVDTKAPVFLVPTTAGTGSEVTKVAVISRPDMNAKWSVFVNTTLAIVDPELTVSLPKIETVNTGLDAFSHAAEAMTGINWNPHSDLVGEAAIKKITANLLIAYNEPDHLEARSELALAANWAGLAFNDPITHVGHAVADAFSCSFHTPHGLNCALALPETMALVGPAMPDRMAVIASAMGIGVKGHESGEELGRMVADGIRGLMRLMNMKSLKEMGYSREAVCALAPDVMSNHLASYCPVEITEAVARALLEKVYDTYQ
jgi:1,3-propanediol dehydrogenase